MRAHTELEQPAGPHGVSTIGTGRRHGDADAASSPACPRRQGPGQAHREGHVSVYRKIT